MADGPTRRGDRRGQGIAGLGLLVGLLNIVRRINEVSVIFLFAVLCVVVFSQVVARYAFHAPFSWSEELARYTQIWLILLASALAMQRGQHIAVDFFTKLLPSRLEELFGVVANVITVGYLLVILWVSGDVVRASSLQITPAMGINMELVYLAVPVAGTLILIEAVITLVRRVRGLPPYAPREA
jgi:TRAP-type transport system small permease protein